MAARIQGKFGEPIFERREYFLSTVFTFISLKTDIARSVKGPKLQGPHAEDAKAKPYLELTILVT